MTLVWRSQQVVDGIDLPKSRQTLQFRLARVFSTEGSYQMPKLAPKLFLQGADSLHSAALVVAAALLPPTGSNAKPSPYGRRP